MAADIQIVSNPMVDVTITSTISSFGSERRFQKDLTIAALKGKLELLTGASASHMQLEVYDKNDKLAFRLNEDESLLGSYHVDDGMRIHVIDKAGKVGEFEDVSKVEKFEISKEEYASRSDSVRAFKQRMKMGQFKDKDPEEERKKAEAAKQKEDEETKAAETVKIDDRCEVHVQGQPTKRGAIKFNGTVKFKPGVWFGIQYDEPHGKNDGSVKGERYFTCPDKYGGFVRPTQVTVGDFPELGLDDELDEM